MRKIEFLSDDLWPRISQIARKAVRRHVAVAYIPSAGFEMLKMVRGAWEFGARRLGPPGNFSEINLEVLSDEQLRVL